MNTRDIEKNSWLHVRCCKGSVGGQQPRRYSSRIRVLQFQIRRMNPMYLGMNRLSLNGNLAGLFEEKRSYEKIVLAERLFDLASEKEDLQADLPKFSMTSPLP